MSIRQSLFGQARSVGDSKIFAVVPDKRPRHVRGGGEQYLQFVVEVQQSFLPFGIQLRQHVVQDQYGVFADKIFEDFQLRQFQRQRGGAQLSLTAEGAYVHAAELQRHVVTLTARRGVA